MMGSRIHQLLAPATAGMLAALIAAPGAALAEDETPDSVFFEALDVRVVNVEVFVTDRQGRPVTGLQAEDFELFEDRQLVEITNFYAVDPSSPAPAASAAPIDSDDDLRLPDRRRPTVPEDQRLHLILYFDNLHLRPFSRNRVLREVLRFLAAHVGPEDRTMVVTFERTLHVQQPFTDDRSALREALLGIEKNTGFAVQYAQERNKVIQNINSSTRFDQAEPLVDFYARERFQNLNRSIDGLKELVATLAGLPGRKALLYVSDGIPMIAGADLFHLLDLRFGEGASGSLQAQRYSARSAFRELTASANANRVTFYTLGAAGLKAHSSLSAESRSSATGGSMIEIDMTQELNQQEPLQMMALDTGGLATFNTNNFSGALERIGTDFESFYSLGYVPSHGGDGRIHRLEVKVRRKGLRVRHRGSYRDKPPETRLTEGVLAALHHGGEVNPLSLRVDFDLERRQNQDTYLVPVTVSVPFGQITLVPKSELHQGRLELVLAVIDDDGDTSIPESTTLPLEIPAAAIEAVRLQEVTYTAELLMRRGAHYVAVAVRDQLSGETAIVRRAIRVGG